MSRIARISPERGRGISQGVMLYVSWIALTDGDYTVFALGVLAVLVLWLPNPLSKGGEE